MISFKGIVEASKVLEGVAIKSPLIYNSLLSNRYGCHVWLKREDLQPVRSYKIRGAYNKMASLSNDQLQKGVVCASAGNHAQGVAYACNKLKAKGVIFMPATTPAQKVKQVIMFGKEYIDVKLIGDTFDDAYSEATKYCNDHHAVFIHPFDDEKVIEGQGTVGLEIATELKDKIDFILAPVGGGGLVSGIVTAAKELLPHTKIIGVEPLGAPSMLSSIQSGKNTTLSKIDKFVDGAAVKRVGDLNFEICKDALEDVWLVPEGKVCSEILRLYNEEAIVVEPAGALTLSALDLHKNELVGKTIVCIVSGSNNDITRTEEIRERSLLYEGLKHYFLIKFPQRAGALRQFLNEVLGPNDDIVLFEYQKKTAKEKGPALIGVELHDKNHIIPLLNRLKSTGFGFDYLNEKPDLLSYLI
jgi:threonine dehydratase